MLRVFLPLLARIDQVIFLPDLPSVLRPCRTDSNQLWDSVGRVNGELMVKPYLRGMRLAPTCLSCLAALLLAANIAHGQSSPMSVALQAGVSYSGWNLALVGQAHLRDFSVYLGPSVSLNRGLPGKGPLGLDSGLNYHIPSSKDWLGTRVNLDYQLHFFKPGGGETAAIHELYLSYGLEFHLTESFSLTQQFGYGGYLESNPPAVAGGGRRNFTGYGGLLRLWAGYRF